MTRQRKGPRRDSRAAAARRALGVLGMAAALGGAAPGAPAGADLEEILRRHAEARGGAVRWAELDSLEVSGIQTTFSEPGAFKLIRKRPNLYRFEQTVLKRPVVEAFDGHHAWWVQPLMGNEWPLPAPSPHAGAIAREAAFPPPLLARDREGMKLSLAGREPFEGQDAWRLDVTMPDGSAESWYLDPATFLEIARVSRTAEFGQDMEKRSYFSDFRSAGGLVVPHRIEMEYGTRNEILEIRQVRANISPDDSAFRQPPPEGMGPLAALAGDWDVKVETRAHPRAPWEAKEAKATIRALVDGGLLEENFEQNDQGLLNEVRTAWSYDRFAKRYRVTRTDDVTFHQNVLEGTFAEGKLTLSNEQTGTTARIGEDTYHTRMILHDTGPDGFMIDREYSTDAGKTWVTEVKLTYARRKP